MGKQVQKETEPPPPKDPPPDFEFVADPPSISAFDLEVVKLTAQFVSRNGRQFLTNLMPEADFLARNISPVTFRVVMPDMPDKPEWKLHGQTIAVTLPLSDPISALKARLFDETGMQAGKQKLQMENIFFKDTNSLAYYNIYPATVVQLQVKERGGRKK